MKRRPKFEFEHLKLSIANLLATAGQEAVIHPYPGVRARSQEAVTMLTQVSSTFGAPLTKVECVKALRKHKQPDIEPCEVLA